MKKKLHHQLKTTLEMLMAETDVLANQTKEATHRQNNNVLKVNSTCCLERLAAGYHK